MIDLHCHMLPAIDDGARDLDTALEMARISLDDGIDLTACTPHIYPGIYHNDAVKIRHAVDVFRRQLDEAEIALQITDGADIQVVPELTERLEAGVFPTLNASRYFLLEPPHHSLPPRFTEAIFQVLACGLVPVITHPERLTWLVTEHYHLFVEAVKQGAWLQVTAGSLTGRFGNRARYWGQRMLEDGLVHILATDAHSIGQRPPLLHEGVDAAAKWVGAEEAERLVNERPRGIIDNAEPSDLPLVPFLAGPDGDKYSSPIPRKSWVARMFSPRESKDRKAVAARNTDDSRSR